MVNRIYLIPTYLSEDNGPGFIANDVKDIISELTVFAVENVRTARRFISSLKLGIDIESLDFHLLDKNFDETQCNTLFNTLKDNDLGIISESGLPGIADPGAIAVKQAHKRNIPVVPLSGGSSILLGLISSGFNGQRFTFHGYLPIDKGKRKASIQQLEKTYEKTGYSQLFIETPYRNQQLLMSLLETLKPNTKLYVGYDLSGRNMLAKTKTVNEWKIECLQLSKIPCLFGIGG